MTQTDKSTASATSTSIVDNLGEIAKKRVEATAAAQAALLKEYQEIGQHWSNRAKSEADLASELIGKLTSARSFPETATACQEWAGRRMQLVLEDGEHLLADSLKFLETAARSFSNGGTAAST